MAWELSLTYPKLCYKEIPVPPKRVLPSETLPQTLIIKNFVMASQWCGGILKYEFVANLAVSLPVKNFENRLTFGEVMGKSLVSCFFRDTVYL